MKSTYALPSSSHTPVHFGFCPASASSRPLWSRLDRFALEQKLAPDGTPTTSAHPARFSPDDKFSSQRLACKKRFNLLPTQGPKAQF
eukprot:CAMPEP_0180115724 /NCGR_PEP_ID=MMETSP0985-20121206/37998_1 /TAXON_ID=483367 /ORGANISM="non described non described, Strain CCMP 2436" /LENGTH=86 /DNA_ID=CAMNT_0022054373 /DNA_START=200 /DNA_END=460 /DNA_ORIENTATION=+